MVFPTKSSSPKKPPFYYIAHPHEAYREGYNAYLGQANDFTEQFQAWNYYLPMDTVRLIPRLNDYLHALISETKCHPERMRRKSFLQSIDTALGLLHRMEYMNKMGNTIAIGSRHIKPVTYCVIGAGEAPCRMFKFHVYSIYGLIDHYTKRYENPCHCHPICLYHQPKGAEMMKAIREGVSLREPLSPNVVMAAAIHFMADMLEHCGPDVTEFFDLFTNDLTCSPDDVDIGLWQKCRERALFGRGNEPLSKRQIGFHANRPEYQPPPKPMKIRVKITDEGDDLYAGAKTTAFQSIVLGKSQEDYYREYYYRSDGCTVR
jgi:hypothetical protein